MATQDLTKALSSVLFNIGGELERIAGHIEALQYAIDEFSEELKCSGENSDEIDRRHWLFEVNVEALDVEARRVRLMAEQVYHVRRDLEQIHAAAPAAVSPEPIHMLTALKKRVRRHGDHKEGA